jgi:cytochrome bd-type quinol oxidase subunit 2
MIEFILILWVVLGVITTAGAMLDAAERQELPVKLWWAESKLATVVAIVFGAWTCVAVWPYVMYADYKLRVEQSRG